MTKCARYLMGTGRASQGHPAAPDSRRRNCLRHKGLHLFGNGVLLRNCGRWGRSCRLLIDDLYRPPVLIVAIEFRVIEAPFCSLLIALVTAITVRLVGVCRCRKNDGEDP